MKPDDTTVRLNIVMPAALESQFRAAIFHAKGMKKGNISEAYAEAVRLWLAAQAKSVWPDAARLAEAAREGRIARDGHARRMAPGERMELAFNLSMSARAMR